MSLAAMAAANVLFLGDSGAGGAAAPAEARVRLLLAELVPKVEAAGAALRTHVVASHLASLESTLSAHIDGLAALRFDLLVSPGLRAGPLERDLAAFRAQVSAVSDCTEATWSATRRSMESAARARADTEGLLADFTMEFRMLARRVAEEQRTAGTLQAHLDAHAAQRAGEGPRAALDGLLERQRRLRDALARLQELCDFAKPAQAAAYAFSESQSAMNDSLRQLAKCLRGGLLERLRVLVAEEAAPHTEALREAQQARAGLQAALSDSLLALSRLQGCAQDLLVWLKAVERDARGMSA